MLKRPAQIPRGLANSTAASIQQRATLCPGLPVCFQCIRTSCLTIRPSPQGLRLRGVVRSHDLRLTWIKAGERYADRQPHSLVPAYLNPVPKHDQDGLRQERMQQMGSSDLHASLCPDRALPVEPRRWFHESTTTSAHTQAQILSIGQPMMHHGVEKPLTITDTFWVLKKCRKKFECLVYEMLFIQQLKPTLNVESHSIRAKLSY